MTLRPLHVCAILLLALGACAEPPPADPAFVRALPTYEALALKMDESDARPPVDVPAGRGSPSTSSACAPARLFASAHDSVRELNGVLQRWTHRLELMAQKPPQVRTPGLHQWVQRSADQTERLTVSRQPGGERWTFVLDVAPRSPRGKAVFQTALRGTLETRSPGGGTSSEAVREDVFLDEALLHSGGSTQTASTRWSYHKEVQQAGGASTLAVAVEGTAPADGGGILRGRYVLEERPGSASRLQLVDSRAVGCGGGAAMGDFALTASWYLAGDGTSHGRADARARGGSLPPGVSWEASTCHQGDVVSAENETYWQSELRRTGPEETVLQREVSDDFPASACDGLLTPARPPPFPTSKS